LFQRLKIFVTSHVIIVLKRGKKVIFEMRKDLVIAVLVTFLMSAMMFNVLPTGSQTMRQYDPWLDYNDDGKINLSDLVSLAMHYGTTGDPTKNVNVTNWLLPNPRTILYAVWNLSAGKDCRFVLVSGGGFLHVGGYLAITPFFEFENITFEYRGSVMPSAFWTLEAEWSYNGSESSAWNRELLSFTIIKVSPQAVPRQDPVGSYSVKAPYVKLEPYFINCWEALNEYGFNMTAVCKVYIYLHHSTPSSADQALNAYSWIAYEEATWDTRLGFGPYLVEGYKEINLVFYSNVSCCIVIYDPVLWTTYESLSINANTQVQRTYGVKSPNIGYSYIRLHPDLGTYVSTSILYPDYQRCYKMKSTKAFKVQKPNENARAHPSLSPFLDLGIHLYAQPILTASPKF